MTGKITTFSVTKEEKLTISNFCNDTVHGIDSRLSCS